MGSIDRLSNDVSGVLRGENKPLIQFEFTYGNIIFIGIMIIAASVVSKIIINSFSK